MSFLITFLLSFALFRVSPVQCSTNDTKGIFYYVLYRQTYVNPGVRPIGILEMSCCIISKAILFMVKTNILEAAGNLQLCAGQEAGRKATVCAMHSLFHSSTTQAVLLADASNAFNSLNRHVSLHNLHYIFPLLLSLLLMFIGRFLLCLLMVNVCYQKREPLRVILSSYVHVCSFYTVPLIQRLEGIVTQV